MTGETYDVVVVGAGTAGSIVAGRLAASGDRSVLLLEHGPGALPGPEVTALTGLPIGSGATRVTGYDEARGRPVVRGRGLGGSSCVNGGYFLRGHPGDFDRWPSWWTRERIAAGYDALDGGDAGGGVMSVTPFADDELGDVPRRFDDYWRPRLGPPVAAAWPRPGLVRVRGNRVDGHRRSTAAALLDRRPPGLTIRGEATVQRTVHSAAGTGRRATGVLVDGEEIAAGEVILCAGTLGTAALLRRSGLFGVLGVDALVPHEHAERIVRFTPRHPPAATALLPAVVHTGDGLEIRAYSDDFARFITGLPPRGVPIGVTDMAHPARGTYDGETLDLGGPDAESSARMLRGLQRVVDMLHAPEFDGIVVPGSVAVDPVVGMSQHASGTLPLGRALDHLGGVPQVRGLRVVDGSILPGGLRSGPHATIAMAAWVIAGELRTG
ncbi:MAG: mycofactocin system GMC family oxidoreductase MftG [Gordonia sp. (in: high G+C Gram-positive bacteria)]|uniref:mycofactocin system GMC family oxidoreductase MftG n=1 Tax=Gordonia sp. (in: high G+C Gram-positive bacteria) TaxID=84139 RepID=UPI0039E2CB17